MDWLPEALATLSGCTVTRLCVDDSATLSLRAGGMSAILRLDGAARLQRAGQSFVFDTDADPASAAALLGLLYDRIAAAALGTDGALELRFASGASLTVLPSEHGVSWSVQTSRGAGASCIAEGRIVWE